MTAITLNEREAKLVVTYLQSLSDRLTAQHRESHSGTEQLLLISAIQDIDLLAVNIREQVEQVTASEPAYSPMPMVEA